MNLDLYYNLIMIQIFNQQLTIKQEINLKNLPLFIIYLLYDAITTDRVIIIYVDSIYSKILNTGI